MGRTIEEIRKAKRESMARRRAQNIELAREKSRIWHHNNRNRNLLKMRQYYKKRFFWGRAMKLKGTNRASYKDLARLWRKQNGLCALTGRKLDRTAELDHIMPRAKGGRDNIENLRWVCVEANLCKRDFTDEELVAICSDIMRWIGERIQMVEKVIESLK
jgi:5-methylcytosine-specific restriction endonuclease McrA